MKPKTLNEICAAQCPKCHDVIFSRHHHDFHWCNCKDVAIDGGKHYVRCSFHDTQPTHIIILIPQTDNEIYNDYNKRINKLGVIKTKQILESDKKYELARGKFKLV